MLAVNDPWVMSFRATETSPGAWRGRYAIGVLAGVAHNFGRLQILDLWLFEKTGDRCCRGGFKQYRRCFFEAWAACRDVQIRFLKVQVEMLRQRLPGNRVIVSPDERPRLLKLGAELNHQTDDLMGVVSAKPYKRWVRELQMVGSPPLTPSDADAQHQRAVF